MVEILMIAVVNMAMIGLPAEIIIEEMCAQNKNNGRCEKPKFCTMKKLFQHKKNKTGRKNHERKIAMMMPSETVIQ